jgi:hypothetical protein
MFAGRRVELDALVRMRDIGDGAGEGRLLDGGRRAGLGGNDGGSIAIRELLFLDNLLLRDDGGTGNLGGHRQTRIADEEREMDEEMPFFLGEGGGLNPGARADAGCLEGMVVIDGS